MDEKEQIEKDDEEKNELDEVLNDMLEKEKDLKPRSIQEYEM